jgi:hypothetical protein
MQLIAVIIAAGLSAATATPQAAREFVHAVEQESYERFASNGLLAWINATYITVDSQAILEEANEESQKHALEWALEDARYLEIEDELDFDTRR